MIRVVFEIFEKNKIFLSTLIPLIFNPCILKLGYFGHNYMKFFHFFFFDLVFEKSLFKIF